MFKFLIVFTLFFAAPHLAFARAPLKCPKGDKACEKKKAKKAAKAAMPSKKKSPHKLAKKAAKKAEKKAARKAAKAQIPKKKPTKRAPPPTDMGEPTPMHEDPVVSTPPEPESREAASTPKQDLEDDIFPESSNTSAPPSGDSSGSGDDFDLGEELPAE